ncbi:uncharacterized protein LOC144179416 isoform X2 [Haemaphysalis longicornis]
MNSVCDGNDDRPATAKKWDQPMTTADMRSRAADWSLADDSQLLAYLESFTQSLTARTAEVQKQLEAIVHETRVSGVKVNNVINDFNHLSSLQFVENRVYDEEVKEGAQAKEAQGDAQPNGLVSKEEQEAALLKRVSEAFRLGVEVVHTSLEVVDLRQEGDSEDDSEDEDEEGGGGDRLRQVEPLLRSLDPYLARPLPALIGSEQFLNDERVGLGELLSDEEEAEEEEKSSRGEYESDKSETDSDLEEEEEVMKKQPSAAAAVDNKMASYMQREFGGGDHTTSSDNEDMFGDGRKEELLSSASSSSSSELNSDDDEFTILRKSGGRASSSAKKRDSVVSSKRSSVSSVKKSDVGGKVRKTEDDLFGPATNNLGSNGLEESEESASPFARKSGLFSGDGKLFDDDDGGDDEEGDLFRDVSAPPKERPPSISNPAPPAAVPKLTQSGKKVPAGGVSMFGGSALPPLVSSKRKPSEVKEDEATAAAAARAPSLSSASDRLSMHSDEDEDSLFREAKKEQPSSKAPVSSAHKVATAVPSRAKVEDIFKDDDDDDGAFALPKTTTSQPPRKPAVAAGGLFGSDDDDEDDLWAPTPGRKVSKPENSAPPSQPPPPAASTFRDPYREEPPPLPKAEDKPKPKTAGGLFDDDDDDFLFSAPSAPAKTESKPTKSFLFDDDEDIFASISSAKPSAGKTLSGVEDKPKLDLFGDGSAIGSASTANRGRSASRGIFLFEDEPSEKTKPAAAAAVAPAVTAAEKQQEQPEVAPPEKEEPTKRRPTAEPISLFGANEEEDEEEDLFAERTTPPTQLADSQSSHSVHSASWSTGSKGDTEPAPTGPSEPIVEEHVTKPRAGSRFLFDQEDDLFKSSEDALDVDLFAPPAAKPAAAESTSPPKKKPAGGVSLFGGSSLFGDELKSRLGRPNTAHAEPEEKSEQPDQEASGGDLFAPPPVLPSRPPLRDTKVETSVSFDEPADQIRTLTSATKDRAKVKAKRRPPTRRKRQADLKEDEGEEGEAASGRESPPAGGGADLFAPSPPSHNDDAAAAAAGTTIVTAQVRTSLQPQPQPRTRLWSDDDTTEAAHQPTDSEPVAAVAREKDRLAPPAPKAVSMVKSPSTEEEDLFALDNSMQPIPEARRRPGQAKPAAATRSQAPFGGSIFDDDVDDDLFADPAAERSAPRRPSLHENSGHFSDDGIFGAADAVSHSSENSSSTKTASASPSTVATPTPTQETRKEVPPPQEAPKKPSGGLFDDDDDDDIFATPTAKPSSALASRPKRSTLFEDDTDDIFSSKPVKPKVQATEKRTSSVAVKKPLPKTTDFKDPLLGDLNE